MADEQQAEPLTGAELNEILGRLDQSRQFLASGINDDVASGFKLASAMSDLARLLATLEAMRPVVVALADVEREDDIPGDPNAVRIPVTLADQARALKERLGW